ncbi:ABC transporter substrate-binding protein [Peribacillus psychrosaccharolyticus]|uniref:ABC transporter substrate-binding protein n=1 Tax=Peribacillus psychrosaccharolyticus TaxID=1407 RepID=UPI003D2C1E07
MKKKWISTLFVIVSLLLLAGCGDSKETETKNSKKEFHYAMSGVYKPFNYKENGKLSGFDVEIGQALAKRMGMKAVPVTNPWETIIQGLEAKKYDAIIGSMTITEERSKAVDFTDTYYRSGAQVFVAEDNSAITSAEKLKGKKIGVVKSSIYSDHAQTLTDKDKIVEYDSDITALMDLPTGRLDAVITDQMVGFRVMKEDAIKIKDIGEPLSQDDQAVAVRKEDKELLEKINAALAEIIEDGTYEKISEKWFGRNILEE